MSADAALQLRRADYRVHLLCPGGRPARDLEGRLAEAGVRVAGAAEQVVPSEYRVANVLAMSAADQGDRVRAALAALGARVPFDLVLFPVSGGLGFRAAQAKRAGLAFARTRLAVWLDDTSAERRRRERRWPAGLDELEADHLERRSFELADEVLAPDRAFLAGVARDGWPARADVRVAGSADPSWLGGACLDLLAAPPPREEAAKEPCPLVTVCVPHFNLGRYLPQALASLAAQTYPALEVLVVDDGSTDPRSRAVFDLMREHYPSFRFVRQDNAGIGATRNRALHEAQGEFFLPFDADNLARRDMVERFVAGMLRRPELAALSCYFLAFRSGDELRQGKFLYGCRPTGGPHVLASVRNVYGDACALYRTAAFRAVGGYETDRHTSFEDWEAFVKLVHAGHAVDVLPDHLFYYRHLQTGFSRTTDAFANHERVLRQFRRLERLPAGEREMLWSALVGLHRGREGMAARQKRPLRRRIAGRLHGLLLRAAARMRGWLWKAGTRQEQG